MKQPALLTVIALNCLVYIVLFNVSPTAGNDLIDYLSLAPVTSELSSRPWTLFSYAFVQTSILQLLFNMLWLYSFGTLLMMRVSSRIFLLIYITGAVAGAITFMSVSSALGDNASGHLIGSSAAVIAVAGAVSVIIPETKLRLPLFGPTKIKWIVGMLFLLFCIGLSAGNAGGNLAHIGGALVGVVSGIMIVRNRKSSANAKNELNQLVEKIRTSGYDALTAEEKQRFYELSAKR